MFALIWGAVRTRTAQVLTVLVLTALAAAVAAAGPWFAHASINAAAAADVAAAPADQRTVSVRQIVKSNGAPQTAIDEVRASMQTQLPLPAADPVIGLQLPLVVDVSGTFPAMGIAYRDDACAHLTLDGACPRARGEVAVSSSAAQQIGLRVGDPLELAPSPGSKPIRLEVVALFSYREPNGPYWNNSLFEADGGLDPAFTALDTFADRMLWEPTATFDVTIPDELLRGDDGFRLGSVLRQAEYKLGASGLRVVNASGPLLTAIARDREEIRLGVVIAMTQTLVLTWFAIGLAGRYTGRDRRGDIALLKLRGSTRFAMLRLAWGQHLLPLTAGAVLGLPLGYLLARWLAGPVEPPAQRLEALLLSVAAAGAVLLGGLLVLAAVEAVVLRRPVADLLRQVGSGRGDWRSGLADLLLLAVAVAAVYQARSSAPDSGLALAAPALVALAVALLLARLLGRVADRGGSAAVRAGRLRLGLTAVQVSRQPGSDRVFALVVVAVALLATTFGLWRGDGEHRFERSRAELGAERVLSVQAPNRTALLNAVRRADPAGDQAMAVVVDRDSTPPVVAVDSSRLAAVAYWRDEYGPVDLIAKATAESPGPRPLPAVTGDRVTVQVRYDGTKPAVLGLVLQNEGTGAPTQVAFGRLSQGEQTRTAPVSGCAEAPGCRILRWQFDAPPGGVGIGGSSVTVRSLTQPGPAPAILGPEQLGDIARWRPGTVGVAPDVAARAGTLRITADLNTTKSTDIGFEVWAVDSALPPPIVLAGPAPESWRFDEPGLPTLGAAPIPVRLDGAAGVLPVVGRAGVLVDLETARRIAGDTNPAGEFQVWLAPGAGLSVVTALREAGLVIGDERVAADRAAALAEQAPSAVARFALIAGVVGLLLAAAAVGVAGAVDRRQRLGQLRALRLQGLPVPVAVGTAYAGTLVLIGTGLAAGLLAAAIANPLARVAVAGFTDGWAVLPAPGALGWVALSVTGLVALVVLGLVGWLSVLPLIRGLRAGETGAGR
ncbi:FtsX-like permease family protein [Paractinoplanes lichenicola]|uniref:ABC transporter permease n=1 Tax=Paractinoplanes lichenicola TaxID=2802976 RepID=A0ABS1VI44_9ACTN|nr:FtsX-like permease family protein [Actinoplanes lichenicola]MBL7254278.1 ABC transporter permease [Actinoplanes lichenicola]